MENETYKTIPIEKTKEKPSTILSVLKWYSIVWITIAGALLFAELANQQYVDGITVSAFLMTLPIAGYLWSLVARRIT